MSTSASVPLWEDAPRPAFPDPLPASGHVETLVVGGGLTGLTTALLLARAGVGVAVLEARSIGSGTTGSSTAKVSLLQGTKLSRILARQPKRLARAYVEANREGQAWLREFCEARQVRYALRPAGTYAATESELGTVRKELDAAQQLGLPVRWSDALDVPFEVHGAVVLEDQFQLDPVDVVHALAEELRAHGGTLHEGHRVRDVRRRDGRITVELAGGEELSTDRLVIATGAPALSGWLLPGATTGASRSYIVSLENAGDVPGMFISAGQPTRSVRTSAPAGGPDRLLVGGSGHTVGRGGSAARHLDDLRHWAAQHFPSGVESHAWSAQDYSLPDELPVFGPLPGSSGRIHLATGYDKWGMTNAVAAGRAISSRILGSPASWSETLHQRRPTARTVATLGRQVLGVGAVQAKAFLGAEATAAPTEVPNGSGTVGRSGLRPTAVSRVDGRQCAVSAVCTHAGGILSWNDQERSWDCPLHGSRFDPAGEVIEGPATRPLAKVERESHQPAGSGRPSA